jgi:hypothetical protein
MDIQRRKDETDFEYELRLCLAKCRREIDLEWDEIVELLGLDISSDSLRKRAYAYKKYDDYVKGGDGAATTILSLSDLHVPFQKDFHVLEDYVGRVDILQLNGDIFDNFQASKFPKVYRINPIEELINGRQYLIDLINYIKPKKVVANYGNHCLRFGNYLSAKLENELQELSPMTVLDYIFEDGFTHYDKKTGTKTKYDPLCDIFDDIDIQYTGTWYSQCGDFIFAHPKTFSSAPMKTAEKALNWFRNEGFVFKNLSMSHTHRLGSYKIGNTNIYEQGAFCETDKMQYSDGLLVNSQKQGFIVVYQDKDGNTIENKTKLISLN